MRHGEIVGFDIDLMIEIGKHLGKKNKIEIYFLKYGILKYGILKYGISWVTCSFS
jgi:ABC-type amino acid transport substrate-binding protein